MIPYNEKNSCEKVVDEIKNKFIIVIKLDIIREYFYAGIGTLILFTFYYFFPSYIWEAPYIAIMCAIIVLSFFIIFFILNLPNSKKKFFRVDYKRNIILFTIFNLAILGFLFFKTEFGYNGIDQDNFYRSAYITQMAYSGYPKDLTFKGYSAFMAPFYWYLLALIARLFQIQPYKMIRIGFLVSYYILPILAYEVWKKLFNEKTSFFIIVLFFTFIANFIEIIWIDHLIAYLFFVPFLIYYFENYKNKRFSKIDYLIAGMLGSLLICTFYLYFILVPIYLFICLLESKYQKEIRMFKEKLKRIAYIIVFMMIFSVWFWLPLTLDLLIIGAESHQNYFFPKYALDMPFQVYLELNLFSILLILGLIFILIKYKHSIFLRILGKLILSVYLLYLLGFIGLLIGFPIVHYRVLILSHYVLIIAFALFYLEFFHLLQTNQIFNQLKEKIDLKTAEIFILLILIFYQNYINTIELYESKYYERSIDQEIPEEVEIFKELDYKEKVFLTQYYEVAAFLPIYLFVAPNAHFSHPSALNNERIKFLEELSECKSSKEFYDKIMKSEFGPIDYFILEPADDNETEFIFDSAELEYYPYRWDTKINFKVELFESSSFFARQKIKGVIIYKTIY